MNSSTPDNSSALKVIDALESLEDKPSPHPLTLPLYSPINASLQLILELILTHGRESVIIPLGLTGPANISEATYKYITSFPQYDTIAFIEGPFIDAFANDKYYTLWYKHEYTQRYETLQRQRAIREAERATSNARYEMIDKAFERFCAIHKIKEYQRQMGRELFDNLVKDAIENKSEVSLQLLARYGYDLNVASERGS